MPALIATITGSSSGLKKELDTVEAMAKRTGAKIQSGLNQPLAGGAHGGGFASSGVMREMVVLIREISRGNWSRVPGSLSILLQRVGFLGKAVGFLGSAGGMAIGGIAAAAAGAAGAFYLWHKRIKDMSESMIGLKLPDLGVKHIPAIEQRINRWAEAQRKVADAVQKTVENYNSAQAVLERSNELTKADYAFRKKQAEERGASPEEMKRLDMEEKRVLLGNKIIEQVNLQTQATNKMAEAKRILDGLSSEEQEKQRVTHLIETADAFEKEAKGLKEPSPSVRQRAIKFGFSSIFGGEASGGPAKTVQQELAQERADFNAKKKQAADARAEANRAIDQMSENSKKRKRAEDLITQAAEARGKLAISGMEIEQMNKLNAIPLLDVNKKMEHHLRRIESHLSDAQRHGAFVSIGRVKY